MSFLRTVTLVELDELAKILAVIGGGILAYYGFLKGRVHHLRLVLKITGSVVCRNEMSYLSITASAKNVAISKYYIDHDYSGVRIMSHKTHQNVLEARVADWTSHLVFDVFKNDQWIEPGETVEEQFLVVIPGCEAEHVVFQTVLRLESYKRFLRFWQNSYWQETNAIVSWDCGHAESNQNDNREVEQ